MDDRGNWHLDDINKELGTAFSSRMVFSLDVGETVTIRKDNGDYTMARFDSAEKNKVTFSPVEDAGITRPYFELAERVYIERESNEKISAQVWDNRNGKIILRTLPTHSQF